ncbi:hypothetical protein TNCT_659931 [Trichonephila clavata]|uniref:Uncharacterized protein n=1 Tax=Trichonephila clavata TaxID=2740835 RepID=A0A8X6IZW7_TRICU|nr:hypothetical protein TNCT_659931 [Trichonephila clavata]
MNSTESAKRPSGKRPKKRKLSGNMHMRGKAVHSVHESIKNSASGKKIQLQDVDSSFIEKNEGFDGYRIFDKNIMFANIQKFASFKKCGGDITLTEQCIPHLVKHKQRVLLQAVILCGALTMDVIAAEIDC